MDEPDGLAERFEAQRPRLRAAYRMLGSVSEADDAVQEAWLRLRRADLGRQRAVVDAFLAAARDGDLDALVSVLDPDVVVRADYGAVPAGASREVRGAPAVAAQALRFSRFARFARPALVNGAAGVVAAPGGEPFAFLAFTVRNGTITEIDILADPERLRRLDLAELDGGGAA